MGSPRAAVLVFAVLRPGLVDGKKQQGIVVAVVSFLFLMFLVLSALVPIMGGRLGYILSAGTPSRWRRRRQSTA